MEAASCVRKPESGRPCAYAMTGCRGPRVRVIFVYCARRYQSLGRCLVPLIFARCFLPSIIFTFCPQDFCRVRRLCNCRSCCIAAAAALFRLPSFAHKSLHACTRFHTCERPSWQRASTPVGPCRNQTVDDVLLIFCPPGPVPRTNRSSTSSGLTPREISRCRSAASNMSGKGGIKKILPRVQGKDKDVSIAFWV